MSKRNDAGDRGPDAGIQLVSELAARVGMSPPEVLRRAGLLYDAIRERLDEERRQAIIDLSR